MKTFLSVPILSALLLCQARAQEAPKRSFEFGFEQRVRNENWNNIFDMTSALDDEREQIRYRTRGWMKAPLSSTIDLFAGLNQETNQKLGLDSKFDEIILENLYVDFKKLFVKGLSLRVGRQNLIRGEGALMLEGGSGDGSRAIYFNAVNLAYTRKKQTIELIGILNPKYDRMLPRINNQRKLLQEWDEQALGLYYTNNNSKKTGLEAYYFYKKEVRDYRTPANAQFQPDRHFSTAGGRIVRALTPRLNAVGEFAVQRGAQHGGVKMSGWSGYGYLKRTVNHRWKPYVQAGYWAFSGDDPTTKDRTEGWDPLFSRWPKWSELYIYSQFRERGVGYWTNLGMSQAETGFTPRKGLDFRVTWYHMGAYHPYPLGDQRIFGDGTGRGDNAQIRMDFTLNRYLRGHVLYEDHVPGNFYRAADNSYFLRFEMSFLIKATPTVDEVKHWFGSK